MFKLAINAGHGLYTAGKRCLKSIDKKETREWTLNSRIVEKIISRLDKYAGIEYIRLDDPTGKKDIALKTRTDKANAFEADLYLAIHHNAGVHGNSGGGTCAYVWDKSKDDSVEVQWRNELYKEIINKTGLKGNRSSPLGKANFHEVRESHMPAVLIECGFMDSSTDTPIILTEDFADKVADACVSVIVRRAGLKKKEEKTAVVVEIPKTTKVVSEQKSTTKKTTDAVAKEVIEGKWGNGADRKKALEKAGYNYSEIQSIVNSMLSQKTTKTPTKTTTQTKQESKPTASETKQLYFAKYTGKSSSISDALKSLNIDSSFKYRSKIASRNNIKAYIGTAKQNTTMLKLLKSGKLLRP